MMGPEIQLTQLTQLIYQTQLLPNILDINGRFEMGLLFA